MTNDHVETYRGIRIRSGWQDGSELWAQADGDVIVADTLSDMRLHIDAHLADPDRYGVVSVLRQLREGYAQG